jgi:hypothetical protein
MGIAGTPRSAEWALQGCNIDPAPGAGVLDADLTHDRRLAIFGGNLRRRAGPIFQEKGDKL